MKYVLRLFYATLPYLLVNTLEKREGIMVLFLHV